MNYMEKFLILYPDTFIWDNEDEIVMYNCSSKNVYKFNNIGLIGEYCNQLKKHEKLYTVRITNNDFENRDFKDWIYMLIKLKLGFVKENTHHGISIISFPPILNLQKEVERIVESNNINIGDYVADNINECTIYLGGESQHPDYYKQIPYPINNKEILNYSELESFLSVDISALNTINIVGDIFSYPYKAQLLSKISNLHISVNFYTVDDNVQQYVNLLSQSQCLNYKLYIYYEKKYNIVQRDQEISKFNISYKWIFIITSDDEYKEFYDLSESISPDKLQIYPVYIGDNLPFLERELYVNDYELNHPEYDKQDIFAHQVMNSNFWGRLTIFPNGNVYSNVNLPPIGTIKNKLYDIIVDEMKSHRAWRLTRDCLSPCRDCLYRYLCPSPSNYEFVIGKPNLCHIHP